MNMLIIVIVIYVLELWKRVKQALRRTAFDDVFDRIFSPLIKPRH